MKYFVMYSVDNPRSLYSGLNVQERDDYEAALKLADEAIAKQCSSVRIIYGLELSLERIEGQLRKVVLESSR